MLCYLFLSTSTDVYAGHAAGPKEPDKLMEKKLANKENVSHLYGKVACQEVFVYCL